MVTEAYGNQKNMGNVLTGSYDIGLIEGVWRFALTAVNSAGQESGFSAEVFQTFEVPSRVRLIKRFP